MELHEALYTTRAMRRVRKDPIPHDVQARILDAAIRAPSGGNQQNWRFLLLDDPAKKAALAPLYQHAMGELWKSIYKPQLDAAARQPRRTRVRPDPQGPALGPVAGRPLRGRPALPLPLQPARPDRRLHLPRRVERHAGRPGRGRRQLPDRAVAVLPPGRDVRDPRRARPTRAGSSRARSASATPPAPGASAPRRPVDEVSYRNTWGTPVGFEVPEPLWPG